MMNETIDQTRTFLTITQQAYVGIGDQNGLLAEFAPFDLPQATELHFYNSGPSPAFDFGLSVKGRETHSRRYLVTPKNTVVKLENCPDSSIPDHGSHLEHLPVAPSDKEWPAIQHGSKDFVVEGQIEYCDEFGQFHCETFALRYHSGNFEFAPMGFVLGCSGIGPMSKPPTPDVFKAYGQQTIAGQTMIPLPRCAQANEPGSVNLILVRPIACK